MALLLTSMGMAGYPKGAVGMTQSKAVCAWGSSAVSSDGWEAGRSV